MRGNDLEEWACWCFCGHCTVVAILELRGGDVFGVRDGAVV